MKDRLNRFYNRQKWILASFFLPFLGMLIVMIANEFVPFGKSSMLYSDMYHQYYPFFVEFRQTLREGGSLVRNWSVGLGVDYLSLISYYLASPLYLLSVFVPEGWLLGFFSLLTPVKLGLAGMFFAIFLRDVYRRDDYFLPLFSVFYALCAWAMGFMWNIMWMDTFALLPLVVTGAIHLLRDKKFVLYTVTVFLAVFSNYYVGFFVCIFVFLLFFCYEICRWKGFKRFFQDLGRIALFSGLAIGMTALLELPALMGLANTQSSVNSFPKKFLDLNMTTNDTWEGLLDVMRQVAGNAAGGQDLNFKEGLPNLYCGVLTLILAGVFFTDGKIRVRDKILSVLLLLFFNISFIVRMLDYIWHGFHFTNMIPYRFSFLYSFVLLTMAYQAFIHLDKRKLWQIGFGFLFFVGICACSDNWQSLEFLLYNGILGVAYLIVLVLTKIPACQRGKFGKIILPSLLCLVLVLELIANLAHFSIDFTGTTISGYPRGTTDTYAMVESMKGKEEDTLFYRSEVSKAQALNDNALLGLNGVSIFSSSANVRATVFMQSLGFGAKNTYNRYCYEYGTPVQNLFLGLKYILDREGYTNLPGDYFTLSDAQGNIQLWENNAYLPLGFMVEDALADVDFSNYVGSFYLQDTAFKAATGLTEDAYYDLDMCKVSTEGTVLSGVGTSGYCTYSNAESGSSVTFRYVMPMDGYFCTRLAASKRNSFYIYVNDTLIISDSISLDQTVGVGYCQEGDVVSIKYKCNAGETGSLTATGAVIRDEVFWEGYKQLADEVWNLTKFTDTYVCGTVTAAKDGLLYTSIPYDSYWTATVDGNPADIVLIGDCMVAVRVPVGSHTVALTYTNTAFQKGLIISGACLAVFLLLIILKKKFGKFVPNPQPDYSETRLFEPLPDLSEATDSFETEDSEPDMLAILDPDEPEEMTELDLEALKKEFGL